MGKAIDVRGVSVAVDEHPLLGEVSFSLDEGRCLALRGDNGAGKTTLLRVLAGLQRPTTGTATVLGLDADERSPAFRRAVAGLIGPPPFARDLTVREHLRLVALTWRVDVQQPDQAASEVLGELGIERLEHRFVHQLSSGQTQLFSLALTLVRPSRVLLVDEPEQRLDADRLRLVAAALRRRLDEGTTLVLATHVADLAGGLADETLTLVGAA